MKKKFLAFAIALIGMSGVVASAQTPSNNCQGCPAENGAPGLNNKMRQPREFSEFAFEGVLLSVDQQARMDSLNAAYKSKANCGKRNGECADSAKCAKADKKDARDGRRDQLRQAHGKAMRDGNPYDKAYVEKVKEILTPEQYTTFLENIVFMPQNMKAASVNANPTLRGRMSDKMKRDFNGVENATKRDFKKVDKAAKKEVDKAKSEVKKIKDKASM